MTRHNQRQDEPDSLLSDGEGKARPLSFFFGTRHQPWMRAGRWRSWSRGPAIKAAVAPPTRSTRGGWPTGWGFPSTPST